MDRSAEVEDYSDGDDEEMVIEDELKMKFVVNVVPLEIICREDFIVNAAATATVVDNKNINQIDLVIHVMDHQYIYQYWSRKSGDPQLSVSSSCQHHYHRHFRNLHDDDDNDKEMIMITCQPTCPPVVNEFHVDIGGVFASHDPQNHVVLNKEDDDEDDYIMSLLNDVNVFHECARLSYEELKEVKKCITQRISEAKPAVLMAKPKTVRIHVDFSTVIKRYYANSAVANSAAAQIAIELSEGAEVINHHYLPQTYKMAAQIAIELSEGAEVINHHNLPQTYETIAKLRAKKLSMETLETKVFDEKDLISSSSCTVCLNEFRVGVDEVQKMPCSHVFHKTCLMEWLGKRNTCPYCCHKLPSFWEFLMDSVRRFLPPTNQTNTTTHP